MHEQSLFEIDYKVKEKRTCHNCHVELTRKDQVKYCSRRCERAYRKKKSEKKRRRVCIQCGVVFIMNQPGGKHNKGIIKEGQFCSRGCHGKWRSENKKPTRATRSKVYFYNCVICGQAFTARQYNAVVCSDECRRQKSNQRRKDANKKTYKENWVQPPPFKCAVCGKMYQPVCGDQRRVYCSDNCLRVATYTKPKKRAVENGVYYEPIDPIRVFERDKWRCQLCGKKLKREHRGTYRDDAPELDHIITWAEGGEHSYKNTQCSCRKCNQEKGSKSTG